MTKKELAKIVADQKLLIDNQTITIKNLQRDTTSYEKLYEVNSDVSEDKDAEIQRLFHDLTLCEKDVKKAESKYNEAMSMFADLMDKLYLK